MEFNQQKRCFLMDFDGYFNGTSNMGYKWPLASEELVETRRLHDYRHSNKLGWSSLMKCTPVHPLFGDMMEHFQQAKDSEKGASRFPMESQGAKRFSDDRQTESGFYPS